MKIIAVTQARLGSSRFPNKILKKIKNKTLLEIHLNRIRKAKLLDDLIVATTNESIDDSIVVECRKFNIAYFRGSQNDVLDRFYKALMPHKADYVVRVTSDCPLIDSHLIDYIIDTAITGKFDYCSNTLEDSFPDGQDVEVFKFGALQSAWSEAKLKSDREHVTPYIKRNSTHFNRKKFKSLNVQCDYEKFKDVRITVDEPCDFQVIEMLVSELGFESSWEEYSDLYLSSKKIYSTNSKIKRNEGYLKSLQYD